MMDEGELFDMIDSRVYEYMVRGDGESKDQVKMICEKYEKTLQSRQKEDAVKFGEWLFGNCTPIMGGLWEYYIDNDDAMGKHTTKKLYNIWKGYLNE